MSEPVTIGALMFGAVFCALWSGFAVFFWAAWLTDVVRYALGK